MGGGAAGSFFYVLAIQPANVKPTLPRTFGGGPSVEVLNIEDARGITLAWKDAGHLAVELTVSSLTTVHHMFHQYPVVGRQVAVLFSELEPSPDGLRRRDIKCLSGGREILNPPLKRLATN